jgi:DHA1 family tetracycline resistance protein-like MFS transporter
MLGAAFGIGFVVGPAAGGILGGIDPHLPFWVAASLSLLNGCWGLFVLPESLSKEMRRPFSVARANPVGSLLLLSRNTQLWAMAAVTFLAQMAHQVLPACFVLYAGYRYQWHLTKIGLTLGLVGICNAVVQARLMKPVLARLGEVPTMVLGLTGGVLGFAWIGLAPTGPIMLAGIPLLAIWGFAGPPGQALMSRRVGPKEQGALQGAIASIQGITGIFGPTIFTQIYASGVQGAFAGPMPGAPFLLSGLLLGLAAVVVIGIVRRQKVPAAAEVAAA